MNAKSTFILILGVLATVFGVATGDFNGDGIDEIAVAYQVAASTLQLDIYRYTTTVNASGEKTHSLSLWQSITDKVSYMYVSLDVAADDFAGDGRDEVAVGRLLRRIQRKRGI